MPRPSLPDEALRVRTASIDAFLTQEQNGGITLGYCFAIEFHPFPLMEDSDTDEEEEEEAPVEKACSLTFQAPLNRARNWKDISGSYAYGSDSNNAFIDFGPDSESHPVDVPALRIEHSAGCEFHVSADFKLLLEVWGSGYANRSLHLDFDAIFRKLTIQSHLFTEDCGIQNLPLFLSRHVDMNGYGNLQGEDEPVATLDARSD